MNWRKEKKLWRYFNAPGTRRDNLVRTKKRKTNGSNKALRWAFKYGGAVTFRFHRSSWGQGAEQNTGICARCGAPSPFYHCGDCLP